jgi:hypothetical protein
MKYRLCQQTQLSLLAKENPDSFTNDHCTVKSWLYDLPCHSLGVTDPISFKMMKALQELQQQVVTPVVMLLTCASVGTVHIDHQRE